MRLHSRRGFLRKAGWLPLAFPLLRDVGRGAGMAGFPATPATDHATSGSATTDPAGDGETISLLLKDAQPHTWVFAGDSITQAAHHVYGRQGYVEIVEERIRWELRRSRDIVINAGVNGSNSTELLADLEWRVGRFRPAVVGLFFGTNDCQAESIPPATFAANLAALVSRIREMGAIPLLQTPNAIAPDTEVLASGTRSRAQLPVYVDIIRDLARREKLVLADHWQHWNAAAAEGTGYRQWLDDPLHPNADGHVEIARQIFRQLSIYDPEAFTCSGKKY